MDERPPTAPLSMEEKAKKIAGDSKPQNNMFAKEVIVTEKEKMRQKLITDKEGMKEVCQLMFAWLYVWLLLVGPMMFICVVC